MGSNLRPSGQQKALRQRASMMNPAQVAELERLIAEQAADNTDYVAMRGCLSLDAPLGDDENDASLYDVIGDQGRAQETGAAQKRGRRVSPEQIKEWRLLRKDGWTYRQIAEYARVSDQTVRRYVSKGNGQRRDSLQFKLEQRLDDLRTMYEAGAFLREIAEVIYVDIGFASWQSCYQGLRELFIRNGIAIRPRDVSRRARSGRPAPGAVREEWQRYWRKQNRKAKKRRHAALIRCDGTVRSGRPCRRWARDGSRYCAVHDKPRPCRWTKQAVLEALHAWADLHGRPPGSRDWSKAAEDHPTFKTVTDLFGKWNVALYEAGLRRRKHPKVRKLGRRALLNRGYKECARPGCLILVAPSWRYCRNKQCQDLRWRAPEALAA